MLQNILPGLRELRAPLSAGYVWLLGLWVLLRPVFDGRNLSGTVYGQVAALSAWAGRPATLLAISFVAYLVGVLSGALTSLVNRNSFRILGGRTFARRFIPYYRNEDRIDSIIERTLRGKLVRRYVTDGGFKARVLGHWRRAVYMSRKYGHKLSETFLLEITDEEMERRADADAAFRAYLVPKVVDIEAHVPEGRADATFVRYRLAGREDQIYNEYDRNRSEGEFRLGLAIPSLFLWVSLTIADSPLWLAGLIFSVVIAYIGAECFSDADMFLYSVVESGRVPLEGFDQLRPDQIRMMPYVCLLAGDSSEGMRDTGSISLSDNEFQHEMFEDKMSKGSDAR